ncbi:MAG: HDOD domain-containing protein [Planctomycetes bacterium]|nr:HDOD domain-containing protein [Planctomycetota bacterium]
MPATLDPWLQSILERIDDLPTLPGVALEVVRQCRADDTTLEDLAQTLSHDPALTARLLRFANSSLYGFGEEVRTLQRACYVLGMKTVQLMALSFSLVTTIPREGSAGAFDYAGYWRRSLLRAVAARALAGRAGLPSHDEAFLAGLLGEIGQVVLARCADTRYAPVLAATRASGRDWPSCELEREQLGFDNREVGSALLASWGLPRMLEQAVRHGADAAGLAPDASRELTQLARVLELAASVTDLFTLRDHAAALRAASERAARWFEIEEDELAALLEELEDPLRETSELLELTAPSGPTLAEILDSARAELLRSGLDQARQLATLRAVSDGEARARFLAEPAHVDTLTGCANELAFQRQLERELRARLDGSLKRALGLHLLEIDAFARLPSEEARQEAQRALGALLTRLARRHDLIARLAPGCFAVLFSDASPFGLRALGERLRSELSTLSLPLADGMLSFSVSLGGACLGTVRSPSDGTLLREVVQRLLLRAQERGAGQVEIHTTPLKS